MADVTIYHNPRCSKSRQTLAILEENGVKPTIVEYLTETPTAEELAALGKKLGLRPAEFIRKGEKIFGELGLDLENDQQLYAAMAANPILIERPIVVAGQKAILGRPPENVLKII
jgi:arsenate reductase